MMSAQTRVVRVLEESPTARSIWLERPAGFTFAASQACRLILAGHPRPFSIASGPDREHLQFIARRSDSPFKQAFFALSAGDAVELVGPRGAFVLEADRPAVMLAGGIGITPMKCLIEHAVDQKLTTPITLVYGNRSQDEVVWGAEVDALAGSVLPGLNVIHTLSQPTAGWTGRTGRIGPALVKELVQKTPGAVFYVAGPLPMVQETRAALHEGGVDESRVKLEIFRGYDDV
jgi:ferredoxin-NADP reductase